MVRRLVTGRSIRGWLVIFFQRLPWRVTRANRNYAPCLRENGPGHHRFTCTPHGRSRQPQRDRFGFLNMPPVNLGTPIDWHLDAKHDPLWKYNLHYGEWALTLAQAFLITGKIRFRNTLMGLLDDWD